MAIYSLAQTMARIKKGTPESPIAVFVVESMKNDKTVRKLDTRFANTLDAQMKINELVIYQAHGNSTPVIEHKYEWLGNFNKTQNVKTVRSFLKQAIEEKRK